MEENNNSRDSQLNLGNIYDQRTRDHHCQHAVSHDETVVLFKPLVEMVNRPGDYLKVTLIDLSPYLMTAIVPESREVIMAA